MLLGRLFSYADAHRASSTLRTMVPASEPILLRAFEYWRNVDKDLGDRVEQGVRAK
jgi:hypothetical protein